MAAWSCPPPHSATCKIPIVANACPVYSRLCSPSSRAVPLNKEGCVRALPPAGSDSMTVSDGPRAVRTERARRCSSLRCTQRPRRRIRRPSQAVLRRRTLRADQPTQQLLPHYSAALPCRHCRRCRRFAMLGTVFLFFCYRTFAHARTETCLPAQLENRDRAGQLTSEKRAGQSGRGCERGQATGRCVDVEETDERRSCVGGQTATCASEGAPLTQAAGGHCL